MKPVCGENEDGCQSLPPGGAGQMSRVVLKPVSFAGFRLSFPV